MTRSYKPNVTELLPRCPFPARPTRQCCTISPMPLHESQVLPRLARRSFLSLAAAVPAMALTQTRDWTNQQPARYPDPDIVALDKSFAKYQLFNAVIYRHYVGTKWAEGPAWCAQGQYLLWSDIPNNRQLRMTEEDGHVSVFRSPSGYSNGNTFDFEGRQLACEHAGRRVVRYEHDGSVTVVADKSNGKPLNSPNDLVVHPDGGVWFPHHARMHKAEPYATLELMPAVEISSVTKTFGEVTAVHDLSLSVPEGSVFGFIGRNGSGKTTTIRMIVNIFYPDRGQIRVLGHEMSPARNHLIGYLPEERGLYRKMQVRALLEFFGELRGGRKVNREVTAWLTRLDLAHCAGRRVDTLSKGMTQRVQFIAAVVPEPKLLILDEPFTGLDPVSADVLRQAILDLRRSGATVILSTHDMTVAETMCDHICMIFRGKKVLDGTLASIQDQYSNDTIRVA